MDVIRALGASLWKMFAGDLVLSIGALATLIALGLFLHLGVLAASEAPYVLIAIILGVFITAIYLAMNREIRKKDKVDER